MAIIRGLRARRAPISRQPLAGPGTGALIARRRRMALDFRLRVSPLTRVARGFSHVALITMRRPLTRAKLEKFGARLAADRRLN